jgi:hypothetical protein
VQYRLNTGVALREPESQPATGGGLQHFPFWCKQLFFSGKPCFAKLDRLRDVKWSFLLQVHLLQQIILPLTDWMVQRS